MSNKRKLPKDKPTTDYTIENFVEDESAKFAALVEATIAQAKAEGEHGVMVVVGESAVICKAVPYGRVWQAGSQEAVDKLLAKMESGE